MPVLVSTHQHRLPVLPAHAEPHRALGSATRVIMRARFIKSGKVIGAERWMGGTTQPYCSSSFNPLRLRWWPVYASCDEVPWAWSVNVRHQSKHCVNGRQYIWTSKFFAYRLSKSQIAVKIICIITRQVHYTMSRQRLYGKLCGFRSVPT